MIVDKKALMRILSTYLLRNAQHASISGNLSYFRNDYSNIGKGYPPGDNKCVALLTGEYA